MYMSSISLPHILRKFTNSIKDGCLYNVNIYYYYYYYYYYYIHELVIFH
jgi:hypothetical protein